MTDFLTSVNENKMQQFSRLTNIKRTLLWSLSIFDQYSYINWKGSSYSTAFSWSTKSVLQTELFIILPKVLKPEQAILHRESLPGILKTASKCPFQGVLCLFVCYMLRTLSTRWISSHGYGHLQLFFTFLSWSSIFITFIRIFLLIFCQTGLKQARRSKAVLHVCSGARAHTCMWSYVSDYRNMCSSYEVGVWRM